MSMDELDTGITEVYDLLQDLKQATRKLSAIDGYDNLLALIQTQQARIEELEEALRIEGRAQYELREELGEWYWSEGEEIRPAEIYEFLDDIGFDPFDLPSSLGERMAIRDQLQKVH